MEAQKRSQGQRDEGRRTVTLLVGSPRKRRATFMAGQKFASHLEALGTVTTTAQGDGGDTTPPPTPSPIYPGAGQVVESAGITLRWGPVKDPSGVRALGVGQVRPIHRHRARYTADHAHHASHTHAHADHAPHHNHHHPVLSLFTAGGAACPRWAATPEDGGRPRCAEAAPAAWFLPS